MSHMSMPRNKARYKNQKIFNTTLNLIEINKSLTTNAGDAAKFSLIFNSRYISSLNSHKRNDTFFGVIIEHAFIPHIVFC